MCSALSLTILGKSVRFGRSDLGVRSIAQDKLFTGDLEILVAPKSKHGSHGIWTSLLSISVTSESKSMKFGETKGVVLQGKDVK